MKKMVTYILEKLYDGNLNIQIGDKLIDFGGEWPVVSFRDLLIKDCDRIRELNYEYKDKDTH